MVEVRIGNKGARVFDTRKGLYHDLEAGIGGDGFTFVHAIAGCNFAEIPDIVAAFAGGCISASPAPRTPSPDSKDDEAPRKQKRDYALKLWERSIPLTGGYHAVR